MAKTFRPSDSRMHALVQEVMRLYHPELLEYKITVDLIDAYNSAGTPAVIHGGLPAYAVVRSMPLKDRVMGRGDAEIVFDAVRVYAMSERQQKALIDHELYHLEFKLNKDGEKTVDDIGRYVFKMRPHDREFGWFEDVAMRWGRDSIESQQAREMVSDEYFKRYFLLDGLSGKEEFGTEAMRGEEHKPVQTDAPEQPKICGPTLEPEDFLEVIKVTDDGTTLIMGVPVNDKPPSDPPIIRPLSTGPDIVESSMRPDINGRWNFFDVTSDGHEPIKPTSPTAPFPVEFVDVGVNNLETRSVVAPAQPIANDEPVQFFSKLNDPLEPNLNNDIFSATSKSEIPIDNPQFQHGPTSLEEDLRRYLKE